MKIVAFSDLHANAWKACSTILPGGGNSRVEDAVKVIEQVYRTAGESAADLVLFGGDLFDRRKSLDVYTFNSIHKALFFYSDLYSMKTIMIPGNHDQSTRAGNIHSLERFVNERITVVSAPGWVHHKGIPIFCVPYMDDGEKIAEFVKGAVADEENAPLLLLHYGVHGAKVNESDFVLPCELKLGDLSSANWKMILSGHYHITQQMGHNMHYIGSAMQHRWGDAGEQKTFMVIDVSTEEPDIKYIESCAPRFLVIQGKTKDYNVENCFVRVVRNIGFSDEKRERLRSKLLERGAKYVEFRLEEEISREEDEDRISFSDDKGEFDIVSEYAKSSKIPAVGLDRAKLSEMGKSFLTRVLGVDSV